MKKINGKYLKVYKVEKDKIEEMVKIVENEELEYYKYLEDSECGYLFFKKNDKIFI